MVSVSKAQNSIVMKVIVSPGSESGRAKKPSESMTINNKAKRLLNVRHSQALL